MKEKQPVITTLHDLLDFDGAKLINAETQLKAMLPEWIRIAQSVKLKEVLQKYLGQVERHISELQEFLQDENKFPFSQDNPVLRAFVRESKERLEMCSDAEVRDACLLASLQEINHYKISGFGTAAAFAKKLEREKLANLFHGMEVDEKQVDDRLTQLADFEINVRARNPITIPEHSD